MGAVWEAAVLQGDFGQNLPGFSTVFPESARYSICCCLYQLRKEFAVQKLGQPPSLEQNKLCFYPHADTCLSQAFCSTSVLRHRISLTWDYANQLWVGSSQHSNLFLYLNILAAVF